MFETFKMYGGTGYFSILFIICLVYLWFTEENKVTRGIFVYGVGCIQLLFFIPFFYWGYLLLDGETYYRILWLLPNTVVIAYSGIKVIGRHTKIGSVLLVILVMVSGTNVYQSVHITKSENLYHLPQEVIDVCDIIMPQDGEERVWAVFPDEMIHYVRQYSVEIQMVYGRDEIETAWGLGHHPLHDEMNRNVIDVSELSSVAEEYNCNYIILEKEQEMDGDLAKYDMDIVGETAEHYVYQLMNVPLPTAYY